ncbi:hypothetical protein ONZ45_g11072 [Pleurotus djamor]|nr:hypothetical protein ONZ45_g11072 [Pleurotus djamor]
MPHKLPLEVILFAVKNVNPEDKQTLLKLLLLSRELHSIVQPRLYESVCFNHDLEEPILAAKLRSFLENITKNNGVLGGHVQKFFFNFPPSPFATTSNYWAMITQILPKLTRLAHFEVNRAWSIPETGGNEIFSMFRTPQLSTFIWEGEDMEDAKQEQDFLEFLSRHPSVGRLEIPSFTFSSNLSTTILLPCIEKLVVHSYHYFLSHPVLRTVSHLGLIVPDGLSLDELDVEGPFSRIQYLAALDEFESPDVVALSSRLPNLRCLVYAPKMSILLDEICDEIQACRFQSNSLEYLALSCTVDDEELADQIVHEMFNTIPTLRIIDVHDCDHVQNEFTRYIVDGPSTALPSSKYPKYWPSERELDEMLSRPVPGSLTHMVGPDPDSMDTS